MTNIIRNRTLTADKLLTLPSPVILCVKRDDYNAAILDDGYQIFSLNLPLAKILIDKSESEFSTTVTDTIIALLPKDKNIYLQDYEMLFDPRYNLEVIKLFCEIARYNKLIVNWCGTYDEEILTYAEPGYDDYFRYKISNYNITCVI